MKVTEEEKALFLQAGEEFDPILDNFMKQEGQNQEQAGKVVNDFLDRLTESHPCLRENEDTRTYLYDSYLIMLFFTSYYAAQKK